MSTAAVNPVQKFFSPALIKASCTSAVVMSVGDLACQSIVKYRSRDGGSVNMSGRTSSNRTGSSDQGYDLARIARFGVTGLVLHGPTFFHGFRAVDRLFGASTSLVTAAKKTATAQFTLFPFYLTCFFPFLAALEGRTPAGCLEKLESNIWPTFCMGSAFWPATNIINFALVPPSGRVLYVNAAGLLWNSYLSWQASEDSHLQETGDAEAGQ
mmetsp:Transcript_11397/g.41712  ORF Transcript_11397/g.41712 Transcript_11397/m.41712 type:complete len:212 (-) Transcript_11397:297-932(-)